VADTEGDEGMHPSAAHIGTPSLNGTHLDLIKLSQICLLKIPEPEMYAVKCLKMHSSPTDPCSWI